MESVRAPAARRVAAIYRLNHPTRCRRERFPTVIEYRGPFAGGTGKSGTAATWGRWKRTGESFESIFFPVRRDDLFWPIPRRNVHSSSSAKMAQRSGDDDAGEDQIVSHKLTESCVLVLQRGDITKWSVDGVSDAIVNAANERMLGGGGVDGAIHRAAGLELLRACRNIPEIQPGVRCPTGDARITGAFRLPVSRIIHTVGPIYDSEGDSASALSSAYRSCLKLARENHIKYVAFPAISCGVYGYPVEEAAKVSLSTIRKNADDLKEVHFVLFDQDAWKAWLETAYELLGEPETMIAVSNEGEL